VRAVTLDALWAEHGEPELSAVKIDVEGAEPAVLRGATRLLEPWHPAVLIEANDDALRDVQTALLEPLGYRRTHPDGFSAYNYLFVAR
jgi:hypothetical protein